MEKKQQFHINISAPNLVNLCIDKNVGDELSGRLYHCFCREPLAFSNLIQMLNLMETFFDSISFPQASTKMRSFSGIDRFAVSRPEKVADQKEIIVHSGEAGTFIICVKFRQNSEWQGELAWLEGEVTKDFSSTIEFVRLLDKALSAGESGIL